MLHLTVKKWETELCMHADMHAYRPRTACMTHACMRSHACMTEDCPVTSTKRTVDDSPKYVFHFAHL